MKKFFSLAMVAAMAISANATQTFKAEKMQLGMAKTMEMSAAQKQAFALKGEKIAKVATDAAVDTLYYGRPDYAYHVGFTPAGGGYYPMIVFSSTDTLQFIKDNNCMHTAAQFDWFVNETAVGLYSDTLLFAVPGSMEADEMYYMPGLFDENENTYVYGESEDYQILYCEPSTKLPLTKCAMYTSTALVAAEGWDCYSMYWNQAAGTFFMGTGMAPSVGGVSVPVDTLFSYMGTPNTTSLIDTISVYVWSNAADPIPAGLTLTVGNRGNSATYTAHTSDIFGWSQSSTGSYYGILNFPVNVTLTGEYIVMINGFQTTGNSIACLTDYYSWNYFSGDVDPTYMEINGRGYSYGNNIAMFVNSQYVSATAIENNESYATKAIKAVRNGQLVIEKGGKKFNVLGAQL